MPSGSAAEVRAHRARRAGNTLPAALVGALGALWAAGSGNGARTCSVRRPTTRERTSRSCEVSSANACSSASAFESSSLTRDATSSSSAASHWYFKKRLRTSAAYLAAAGV